MEEMVKETATGLYEDLKQLRQENSDIKEIVGVEFMALNALINAVKFLDEQYGYAKAATSHSFADIV